MFEKLHPTRKTGAEPFTAGETPLGFSVLDFWKWSSSNMVANALRGHVAEFLVARALGAGGEVRNEWDSYDLVTKSHLRVEVKSAAYLQSWAQRRESSISFDIRETLAWDADTNTFAPESARCRQADLYVFALLAHREKASLNPLDVTQWKFHLLESVVLNQNVRKQRRISLKRLMELKASPCDYADLARVVWEIERPRGSLLGPSTNAACEGPERT
jgi:hypothetical protein